MRRGASAESRKNSMKSGLQEWSAWTRLQVLPPFCSVGFSKPRPDTAAFQHMGPRAPACACERPSGGQRGGPEALEETGVGRLWQRWVRCVGERSDPAALALGFLPEQLHRDFLTLTLPIFEKRLRHPYKGVGIHLPADSVLLPTGLSNKQGLRYTVTELEAETERGTERKGHKSIGHQHRKDRGEKHPRCQRNNGQPHTVQPRLQPCAWSGSKSIHVATEDDKELS